MGVVFDEVETQIEQSPSAAQQSTAENDPAPAAEQKCHDCLKHYERRLKRLYAD